MYKLVTCPESELLELVEYLDTPLGMLIHRCSKFRPVCAMTCTRSCAVVLDRKAMEIRASGPIVVREGRVELDVELEGDLVP